MSAHDWIGFGFLCFLGVWIYFAGYSNGRRATHADLERVSKSLAEGMSVGHEFPNEQAPLTQKQLDELFEISPRNPASDISRG